MYLVTCTNVNPLLKYDQSHMYSISAFSSPLTNPTHKVNCKHIVFFLYTQNLDHFDHKSKKKKKTEKEKKNSRENNFHKKGLNLNQISLTLK